MWTCRLPRKAAKAPKGMAKARMAKALRKLKEGSDRTPEGKPICFRYNAKGCKNGAKRHIAHVCVLCFGKHPASQCPQKPAKTDGANNAKN